MVIFIVYWVHFNFVFAQEILSKILQISTSIDATRRRRGFVFSRLRRREKPTAPSPTELVFESNFLLLQRTCQTFRVLTIVQTILPFVKNGTVSLLIHLSSTSINQQRVSKTCVTCFRSAHLSQVSFIKIYWDQTLLSSKSKRNSSLEKLSFQSPYCRPIKFKRNYISLLSPINA